MTHLQFFYLCVGVEVSKDVQAPVRAKDGEKFCLRTILLLRGQLINIYYITTTVANDWFRNMISKQSVNSDSLSKVAWSIWIDSPKMRAEEYQETEMIFGP